MLDRTSALAIYLEGFLGEPEGKMAYGILRYSPNPICCIVDSRREGQMITRPVPGAPPIPVVRNVDEAAALGSGALVLGIATSGGRLPASWLSELELAVDYGMDIINGLHDPLAERLAAKCKDGARVWDVRREPEGLGIARRRAASLPGRRVLFVGSDMSVGKMTAALELFRASQLRGLRSEFVATGQTGICITGRGVPLDAVRVDYAAGAIEQAVMQCGDVDLIWVEGQGALGHPGSTSTLPLMRGSCPTHLIFCHRAGQTHLRSIPDVAIPSLPEYLRLYETLTATCGTFPQAKVMGICLNTAHLDAAAAKTATTALQAELNLPVVDPVRDGVEPLLDAVLA